MKNDAFKRFCSAVSNHVYYQLFTIRFSLFTISAPVAQLDRVSDSDSEGRAFESHQAHQIKSKRQEVRDKKLLPLVFLHFYKGEDKSVFKEKGGRSAQGQERPAVHHQHFHDFCRRLLHSRGVRLLH